MDFFDTYFILILIILIGLIPTLVYVIRKNHRAFDRSFELSNKMAKRQEESLKILQATLDQAQETNKLLSEILKASKK